MNDNEEKIEHVQTEKLNFDYKNPKLIEFGVNRNTSADEIQQILWDEMAVEEIVLSISASGFLAYEPLIVKPVAIEPNKLSILLYPSFVSHFKSDEAALLLEFSQMTGYVSCRDRKAPYDTVTFT